MCTRNLETLGMTQRTNDMGGPLARGRGGGRGGGGEGVRVAFSVFSFGLSDSLFLAFLVAALPVSGGQHFLVHGFRFFSHVFQYELGPHFPSLFSLEDRTSLCCDAN
jgi:hypothetical protein